MLGCRGVLGGRRFGMGVLQRREIHRANHPVAIRKLGCSVGRVVLGAVAVQKQKEAGECTRGSRLCCAMASARCAMGSPMRKRKGEGVVCLPCATVLRAVFVALAAKATFEGGSRGPRIPCTVSLALLGLYDKLKWTLTIVDARPAGVVNETRACPPRPARATCRARP